MNAVLGLTAHLRRLLARFRAAQGGFTLAELMIVVSIVGGISLALGAAFGVSAKATTEAQTRLRESHDAQLLTTYFQRDAASATSILTAVNDRPAGACGAVPLGARNVVVLGWTEVVGASTIAKAAFYFQPEGTDDLVRRFCENGAPTSEILLARDAGDWSLTMSDCTAPCTLPARLRLGLTHGRSKYEYSIGALMRTTNAKASPDVAPTLSSITLVDAPFNNGNKNNRGATNNVQFAVTFSEPVMQVYATDFRIRETLGGAASVLSVGGAPTVARTTWHVTVGTSALTGTGTLALDLFPVVPPGTPATKIADRSGKKYSAGPVNGPSYTIDKVAPTVTLVAKTPQPPTATGSATFTVTFSEPVDGFDVADIVRGGSAPADGTITMTGANPYDITVSGLTTDQNVILTIPIGTVTDLAGNGNSVSGGASVMYDTAVPTVLSIVRAGNDPTNAGTVSWTVTFSEPVSGVNSTSFSGSGPTDFILAKTGLGGTTNFAAATKPCTGALCNVWTVSVGTGSGSGTIGLTLLDNNSIVDQLSKQLGGPGGALDGSVVGPVYTIDRTAPTVASLVKNVGQASPTASPTASFTATFSEPVTGFDGNDVTRTGTAGGGTVSVTGGPTVWTITVSGLTSDGTVIVQVGANKVTDLAGNNNSAGSGTAQVVYDASVPTVRSIVRSGVTPTNASSVSWTVTFSENVTGVNTTDFRTAVTGLTGGPAVTGVSPVNGSTYTVTAGAGGGVGTLGLNLADDNSIIDTQSKPLGGSGGGADGSFTGEVYDVDRVAPTISSVVLRNKPGGAAGRLEQGDQIVVTYSERMKVSSFCSTWSGDGANQNLPGITMRAVNGGGSGDFDSISLSSSPGCTFRFGTIDLGRNGYVSSSRDFTNSTASWDQAARTLMITLGAPSGSTTTVTSASTATYAGDGNITDPGGNQPNPGSKTTANSVHF